MTHRELRRNEALALLQWQIAAGADEAIEEAPVNRLARPEPAPAPEAPRTAAPRALPAAPGAAGEMADSAAAGAATLGELERAIREFSGCSLKATAMNTVFCDGDPASRLMLIGEAPGADEDRLGRPFVGASGRLLDRMMAAIGKKRADGYYISNILPWRPPGNRKPTPAETALCLPFIRRHIDLAKPKVLVLLGGTAVAALLGITEGITRIRGRWYSYRAEPLVIPAIATFHPAYLLRQPQAKGKAWQDLLEIKSKLENT
jgi:uracil-DNA glycosylase